MISKAKCHILTHIVEDIQRFGPAITLSTETFESFNAVFRRCSVLSNHHAPSKDIAFNMADIDRFKHISSGGIWYEDGEWVGPGKDVTMFFSRHEGLQQLMGWSEPPRKKRGSYQKTMIYHTDLTWMSFRFQGEIIRKPGKGKQQLVKWKDTLASSAIPIYVDAPEAPDSVQCIRCISCKSVDLDTIRLGSFVVFDSEVSFWQLQA